jgi:hypothetical protein
MFAANVFTIIDSQDMQERHRLGPVAGTPGGASRAPTAWNGTLCE